MTEKLVNIIIFHKFEKLSNLLKLVGITFSDYQKNSEINKKHVKRILARIRRQRQEDSRSQEVINKNNVKNFVNKDFIFVKPEKNKKT